MPKLRQQELRIRCMLITETKHRINRGDHIKIDLDEAKLMSTTDVYSMNNSIDQQDNQYYDYSIGEIEIMAYSDTQV